MNASVNPLDLINQTIANAANLFNVAEIEEIPSVLLAQVSEIQNSQGENESGLNEILNALKNHYKGDNLSFANTYFEDLIKEAVLANDFDDVFFNITDHIERYVACKAVSAQFNNVSTCLNALGLNLLPMDFETDEVTECLEFNSANPELAILTACAISNIIELTSWLYLSDDKQFSGSIVTQECINKQLDKAVQQLDLSKVLYITNKEYNDFVIYLSKFPNDNQAIVMSKPVKKLFSLHI